MSVQPRDAVVVVPGLLAVGLGLLYGAGAVIKSGQIRGEQLNVRDTLPAVPLEQLLALGIGTIVTSLAWALAFVVFVLLFASRRPPPPPRIAAIHDRPRVLKALRIFVSVFIVLGVGWWFYSLPFFVAIGIAAFFLLLLVVDFWAWPRGRRYVVYVVVAYFSLLVVSKTGQAYVSPDPLPQVTLQLQDESSVRGTLVVSTGEGWYVTNRPKTYRALPRSRVKWAVVTSQEREREPRPVLKVVWEGLRGLGD